MALSRSFAEAGNARMFLEEQLTVHVPVDVAAARISAWLAPPPTPTVVHPGSEDTGIGAEAYAAGTAVLSRAGFAGLTKEVAVQTLPPHHRGRTVVIVVRMVATGPAGHLFPVLDADLELSPVSDHVTLVFLRGTYRPPLGSVGAVLDRAVLHHAAKATARRLISQAAEAATNEPPEQSPVHLDTSANGR